MGIHKIVEIAVGISGIVLILLHWIVWAGECSPVDYIYDKSSPKPWKYWLFLVFRFVFLGLFACQVIDMIKI